MKSFETLRSVWRDQKTWRYWIPGPDHAVLPAQTSSCWKTKGYAKNIKRTLSAVKLAHMTTILATDFVGTVWVTFYIKSNFLSRGNVVHLHLLCLIHVLHFSLFFFFWTTPRTLMAYSWLKTTLGGLEGSYRMPRIKPESATYKTRPLSALISLCTEACMFLPYGTFLCSREVTHLC